MEVRTTGSGIHVDSALDAYVKRRPHLALGRFSSRVERVNVALSHENGPNGGVVETCCFRVRLLGLPAVVIKQADFDLRSAIDRAVNRIGCALAIRLL
jgi:ribosome-associated translation inhibitor RaiA